MDNQGDDKMRELLICLTDNASSPIMLWQMVSSSALAKDVFETWPRGRLLSTMRGLSPDIRQVAADYAFLTLTGNFCQSEESHLENDESLLPEVILEPLHVLKRLASVNETIETLTTSDVWKASNDLAISAKSKSKNHRIEIALWRFAVLWAIHNAVRTDPRKDRGVHRMEKYRVYLGKLSRMDLTDMAKVYDDLSYMIQQAYPENFATAFEIAYYQHTKLNKEWNARHWRLWNVGKQWHEQAIMLDAEARIDCFVDQQMARGLPFLCSLHNRILAGLSPPPAIRILSHYFQPAFVTL